MTHAKLVWTFVRSTHSGEFPHHALGAATLHLAGHALHHFLGLLKLADELVDVLHGGAGASSDALAAAGVEHAGIAALTGYLLCSLPNILIQIYFQWL